MLGAVSVVCRFTVPFDVISLPDAPNKFLSIHLTPKNFRFKLDSLPTSWL